MYQIDKIVEIPHDHVNSFEKAIQKFQKIAKKLDINPIEVETVNTNQKKKITFEKEKFLIEYNTYHVLGSVPVLNGWVVRARIDASVHSQNIIRSIVDVPERFRNNSTLCEHCNSNRFRNKLFILEHIETGEWKQVGSSCLKQFVAFDEVEKVISGFENLISLIERIEDSYNDEDHCRRSYSRLIDLQQYLKLVIDSTNRFGYISSKIAYETFKIPTSHDAISTLTSTNHDVQAYCQSILTNENISKIALDVIEYFKNKTPENDYERVLNIIAIDEFLTYKELNYAASMYISYKKAHEKFQEQSKKVNEHLDLEVGKRYKGFKLNLTKIIPIDGQYGTTYLHIFEDDEGRSVKWFGSSRLGDEGTYENLSFTVNGFDEYKGKKQTMITRVKN